MLFRSGAVIDETLSREVRVTVIATGFDGTGKREAEQVKTVDLKAFAAQAAERAPSLRRRPGRPAAAAQLSLSPLAEDELDIPTFLRRQAD